MKQLDPRTAPSMFTRGAVDLGAIRDRAAAQAKAEAAAAAGAPAAPAPAPAGGAIVDVTEASFQEVMERSLTVPVLLLFSTEWATEAAELRAELERLATESDGAFVLGRVDAEKEPRVTQAFRVQSVPTVYAVIGGQPTPGFEGVIDNAQLKQFVDAVIKAGGGEPAEAPEDPRLLAAEDALMDGELDAAAAAYGEILKENPGDAVAQAGLAQVELLRRIAGVDPNAALAAAEANPDDVAAQTLAADIEVLSGNAEQGYNRLVALVRRTAGAERDQARLHLISLLALAAPEDPVVAKARRALASALF
ncbi:tetratricopeptide repeat protein [Longispora sp. K20-0274]|uniref:co-chaperone YbbN n=1 Tax=Longispora sp. K20-0274 TaxID=3088255 RepID=UPI00399C4949